MSQKIAPTLRHAIPRPLSPREVMTGVRRESVRTYNGADAYRELHALLAVARAAKRDLLDSCGDIEDVATMTRTFNGTSRSLARALMRLDRVSSRPGRGRKP